MAKGKRDLEVGPRTGIAKDHPTHHGWGADTPPTPRSIRDAPTGAGGTINVPSLGIPSPSGGKSPALDFTDALMRGDPRATEALARSMADAKRNKNMSLADQFMADSTIGSVFWRLTGRKKKDFDAMLERYRDEIRRAHRFHLDDDFVRMATQVSSSTTPQQCLHRLQFALLPYEITWMEFDPRVKMRTIHNLRGLQGRSLDGVPDRMGIMLYRINNTDWLCQLFAAYPTSGRELLAPHLTCYFVSAIEHDFAKAGDIHFGASAMSMMQGPEQDRMIMPTSPEEIDKTSDDPHNLSKACLWGYGPGSVGIIDTMEKFETMQAPTFLRHHGDSGQSRYCKKLYEAVESDRLKETFGQMILAELAEFGGFVRWVITVLAMLSEIPYRVETLQPQGHMRIGLTGRRRYLDYHRLTLRLPKTHPVAFIERKLRNIQRRHRAHEVLSHWRNFLKPHACAREEHEWEYDFEAGYRLCGKCMSESTRVKDHVRGDPELGWVKKEYVVKKEDT